MTIVNVTEVSKDSGVGAQAVTGVDIIAAAATGAETAAEAEAGTSVLRRIGTTTTA